MKEIDFTEQILQYKKGGLLADEKAGYPPKCKPGYEVSEDKKKCVPKKDTTKAAKIRNALARLDQTDISTEAKKAALRKIKAAAKKFGIKVSASTGAIDYSELY
jgi:hypothetical protein|tara:strand:- start:2336 stop:2647 length:312 start_codon:yes stop_codon:yes gene_type:complete